MHKFMFRHKKMKGSKFDAHLNNFHLKIIFHFKSFRLQAREEQFQNGQQYERKFHE